MALPKNIVLRFASGAEVIVTGLRNPCYQLDDYQKGLTAAVLDKDDEGNLVRKSGIMSVVKKGGIVNGGDSIEVILPAKPYEKLEKV